MIQILPVKPAQTCEPQLVEVFEAGHKGQDQEHKSLMRIRAAYDPNGNFRPPGNGERARSEIVGSVIETGSQIRVMDRELELFLDFKTGEGKARLTGTRHWNFMRQLVYFYFFLNRQGLLLHASGVVRRGAAYVFPGPSGAGKTTIVRQSMGAAVLSDDITGVQLVDGEPQVIAHGTPFHSDWGRPGEELSAPVKGIFFPIKAKTNRVVPLNQQDVLTRLLPCIFTFTTWRPWQQRLFDLTVRLAESVAGYDLYFNPTPDFWRVLDGS
jgi:hypothetical protein